MNRVLIVGSGDVARRAIPWLAQRFTVFALSRSAATGDVLRRLGARVIVGDLDDRRSLRRLSGIADHVLHFAPPPAHGHMDTRTRNLLAALGMRASLPQRIIYISTTGVYGDCGGAWMDETRPCRPASARARRRVDAEARLRRFGRRSGVSVGVLRAPGIYADDRLPLDRLRRGDPVLRAPDDVFTNHIHADDLAQAASLALFRAAPCRVYNAVDSSALKMGDYFTLVADAFGLPRPPRMARDEIVRHLPPMTLSFMSESRRIANRRFLRELRLRLRYPSVVDGLTQAVAAHAASPI